jgi:leucyl aminopeptidase
VIKISVSDNLPTIKYQLAIPYLEAGIPSSHPTIDKSQLEIHRAESKLGQVARIDMGDYLALVIGSGIEFKPRDFAAYAVRAASDKAPLVLIANSPKQAQLLAEGALLGQKTPTSYKSGPTAELEVLIHTELQVDVSEQLAIAGTILKIREVINRPANDIYPESLAEFARDMAKNLPIEIEIWDETKLAQERCGGILGVGRGSVRPPRLVKLTYRGGGKHIALVGKGITFDTGGLSLKPAESMVGMKYDMAGAATVLGAVVGCAQAGLKADMTAFMCLAENMPSGSATRPGDVLTLRNGKTVEVLNTDAEGRLVLGDGLALASELKPDHIIDVATLTGAATIALGNRYAGLMGTGPAVELALKASKIQDELLWHMPLPQELRELLNSELADMTNVKIGNRAGGMLIGGLFLQEFIPANTSWAHLDIATSANNDLAPYSVVPQGATGVMIRTLIEMARQQD